MMASEATRGGRDAEVVHASPREEGSGFTPCCGRTPFELSADSRLTLDWDAVTCRKRGSWLGSSQTKEGGKDGSGRG
jgi:hypothetical protein